MTPEEMDKVDRKLAEFFPDIVSISSSGELRVKDPTKAYQDWELWSPTRNIAQAEVVINEMTKLNWNMTLYVQGGSAKIYCGFSELFSSTRNLKEYADMKQGICLATLPALGLKVEE